MNTRQPTKLLTRFLLATVILSWGCALNPGQAVFRDDKAKPATANQRRPAEDTETALPETADRLTKSEVAPADPAEITPAPETTAETSEIKDLEALGTWEEGRPEEADDTPEITYDFPVTMNRQVEYYLDFFQNKCHDTFADWLRKAGRYLPLIQQELARAGLPLDLAYLPMIESGYNLTAYSSARAVGPWQFMASTGRMYGLKINGYVDERRDPIKSTQAAVSFLKDLYQELGSWHLAVAAYNGGLGRIRRAMKRSGSQNFWELARGKILRTETKRYVPKLIAAIMIAKAPKRYGFAAVVPDSPLAFEIIEAPRWTTLQAVATAIDEPLEKIRNLNRQLRRLITPPGEAAYPLKVPVGKKELLARNLPRVKAVVTTRYRIHVVREGESVTRICRKYRINKKTLLKANNLRSASLSRGQRLRIPYTSTSYKLLAEDITPLHTAAGEDLPENLILHKVMPGETTSEIAHRYNVPIHMIAAWNNLADLGRIRAGQQLALYLKQDTRTPAEQPPPTGLVTPKRADLNRVVELRGPGKKQRPAAASLLTYYEVRGGDSLWTIAQKYQTTPAKIKHWNNLKGNLIKPGLRLRLKPAFEG